ncbi:MAG: peptidoglycan-binding domain-containing protein [Patescibacteria group bacterium]
MISVQQQQTGSTLFFKSFLVAVSIFVLSIPVLAEEISTSSFYRNLSVGSQGADVVALQKMLNTDVETQVSGSGIASIGFETDYFGSKTFDAVKRFQWKYRDEILFPNGLSQATGFVGAATRKKLSSLQNISTQQNLPVVTSPVVPTPVQPEVTFPGTPATELITPNPETPLDKIVFDESALFAALDRVGAKQGYTKDALTFAKEQVKKEIDLNHPEKKFIEEVQKSGVEIHGLNTSSKAGPGSFLGFFKNIVGLFAPEKANALTTGLPFGARILFILPCTCSGNWLITLTPLPPEYPALLTYYMGTQMYMTYSLPFSLNAVGAYTPASTCLMIAYPSCYSLPQEGLIGGVTGSR